MTANQLTMLKFAAIAVAVGLSVRLLLFIVRAYLQFPAGISLLLSIIAGCLAGWYLLYRNKHY